MSDIESLRGLSHLGGYNRYAKDLQSAASRPIETVRDLPAWMEPSLLKPTDGSRKNLTALLAFAIDVRNRTSFEAISAIAGESDIGQPFSVRDFQLNEFFLPLHQGRYPFLTQESMIGMMESLTGSAVRDFSNTESNNLRSLYTPFLREGHQLEVSVPINKFVRQLAVNVERLQDDRYHHGSIYVYREPRYGEVINSTTRLFSYPHFVPVNYEPNDFDSGDCDKHNNTSLRRGDHEYLVARRGDLGFFVSTDGRYGWGDVRQFAEFETQKDQVGDQRFYTGNAPFFYLAKSTFPLCKSEVLLPGDAIYEHNGRLFAAGRQYDTTFNALDSRLEIDDTGILPLLDYSNPVELQQGIDYLFNQTSMPYMKIYDCSEFLRRFFALGGISVRRYSQDMMTDLEHLFANKTRVTKDSSLDIMTDTEGIYVVNLIQPTGSGEESRHVYLVSSRGGELDAISMAFSILGDTGAVESPIGIHRCSSSALQAQLDRGRVFDIVQIARKPNR